MAQSAADPGHAAALPRSTGGVQYRRSFEEEPGVVHARPGKPANPRKRPRTGDLAGRQSEPRQVQPGGAYASIADRLQPAARLYAQPEEHPGGPLPGSADRAGQPGGWRFQPGFARL